MDRIITKSPTARWRRRALAAVTLLLVAGGTALLASIDFRTRRVDRTTLSLATVKRGTMEVKIGASGVLLSHGVEQLAARVPGRVIRRAVKPGTLVNAGDLLVELENPQLLASAEEAQSAWEGAMAELQSEEVELQTNLMNQEVVLTQLQFNTEKAQARADADDALAREGLTSRIELQRSRLDLSQLRRTHEIEQSRLQKLRSNIGAQLAVKKSRVAQLARALERARAQVADLRIVAGISGVVQAINVEAGEQLQPGAPVGHIARQDDLYAELRVPAREASQLRQGQRVEVDTRNGVAQGRVSRIDPGVTDGTVTVDVALDAPLPPAARPQLQVEGVIYVTELRDTLYVARPAYVKNSAAISVYRLDPDGRYATRVRVDTGQVSLHHMQVRSGLREGDRIVTTEVTEFEGQNRVLLK